MVKFSGTVRVITGGIESLDPPSGFPRLAQSTKEKENKIRKIKYKKLPFIAQRCKDFYLTRRCFSGFLKF
jgi:hypothetical protein